MLLLNCDANCLGSGEFSKLSLDGAAGSYKRHPRICIRRYSLCYRKQITVWGSRNYYGYSWRSEMAIGAGLIHKKQECTEAFCSSLLRLPKVLARTNSRCISCRGRFLSLTPTQNQKQANQFAPFNRANPAVSLVKPNQDCSNSV